MDFLQLLIDQPNIYLYLILKNISQAYTKGEDGRE